MPFENLCKVGFCWQINYVNKGYIVEVIIAEKPSFTCIVQVSYLICETEKN